MFHRTAALLENILHILMFSDSSVTEDSLFLVLLYEGVERMEHGMVQRLFAKV